VRDYPFGVRMDPVGALCARGWVGGYGATTSREPLFDRGARDNSGYDCGNGGLAGFWFLGLKSRRRIDPRQGVGEERPRGTIMEWHRATVLVRETGTSPGEGKEGPRECGVCTFRASVMHHASARVIQHGQHGHGHGAPARLVLCGPAARSVRVLWKVERAGRG
jgi:hypothetical protein